MAKIENIATCLEELRNWHIAKLTDLLCFPFDGLSNIPTDEWLVQQEVRVANLPDVLLRPRGIKKTAVKISRVLVKDDGDASLCPAHYGLDPQKIRALFGLVMYEVTNRTDRLRAFKGEGGLYLEKEVNDFIIYVSSIASLWMGEESFQSSFGITLCDGPRQIATGCEACTLSAVGGDPKMLGLLYASLLSRESSGPPRLLKFVKSWINQLQRRDEAFHYGRTMGADLRVIRQTMQDEKKKRRLQEGKSLHSMRKRLPKNHTDEGYPLPNKRIRRTNIEMFMSGQTASAYTEFGFGVLDKLPGRCQGVPDKQASCIPNEDGSSAAQEEVFQKNLRAHDERQSRTVDWMRDQARSVAGEQERPGTACTEWPSADTYMQNAPMHRTAASDMPPRTRYTVQSAIPSPLHLGKEKNRFAPAATPDTRNKYHADLGYHDDAVSLDRRRGYNISISNLGAGDGLGYASGASAADAPIPARSNTRNERRRRSNYTAGSSRIFNRDMPDEGLQTPPQPFQASLARGQYISYAPSESVYSVQGPAVPHPRIVPTPTSTTQSPLGQNPYFDPRFVREPSSPSQERTGYSSSHYYLV